MIAMKVVLETREHLTGEEETAMSFGQMYFHTVYSIRPSSKFEGSCHQRKSWETEINNKMLIKFENIMFKKTRLDNNINSVLFQFDTFNFFL